MRRVGDQLAPYDSFVLDTEQEHHARRPAPRQAHHRPARDERLVRDRRTYRPRDVHRVFPASAAVLAIANIDVWNRLNLRRDDKGEMFRTVVEP